MPGGVILAGEPTDGGAVISDLLDLLLLRCLFLLFCWAEEASATGVEAATGGGVTPRRGSTTGAANFLAGSFSFLIFFFVTWTADVEAPDTEGSRWSEVEVPVVSSCSCSGSLFGGRSRVRSVSGGGKTPLLLC